MNKKTVRDVDVAGRRVLLRVDFNVPFKKGTTAIADDSRIRAALPTINYLMEQKARTIICSHLGRPKGQVVEEMRLEPAAACLSVLLNVPVAYALDCVGEEAHHRVAELAPGSVLVLENLRFHVEEEKNDDAFARELASLADVYVNDAFGVAHRGHASVVGVARHVPAVAGLLMEQELEMLGTVLERPQRPLAAVLGGAKVADKMAVVENLLARVDLLIIGGGMASTFLKAQGYSVGSSLIEAERVDFARDVLRRARETGVPLLLPADVVVAAKLQEGAEHRTVPADQVPEGWSVADVGSRAITAFTEALKGARTVVWNGPLGVFEIPCFDAGTRALAEALAAMDDATTIVGGGSTAEAVESLGLTGKMTHVSTGGGASLEFLEGKTLPGVAALLDKE